MIAVSLIIGVVSAFICAMVADSKDRNVGKWAALGFFFGIFALIAIVCLPALDVYAPYDSEPNRPSYLDGSAPLWN